MMRKKTIITLLLAVFSAAAALADEEQNQPRTYIGVNPGQSLAVFGGTRIFSLFDVVETYYLPVHVAYAYSLDRHWAVAGTLLYRFEQYGDQYLIHEFGITVGPRFSLNYLKGFFVEFKAGVGFAFGSDYDGYGYSRLDLILQPELGVNIALSPALTLTVGGGVQSLIPLNEWTTGPSHYSIVDVWSGDSVGNIIAGMMHLYCPVLNLSLAVVF